MFFPCISNRVLQSKKGERENQRLKTLKTTAAPLVPVEHMYIKVTASQLTL